MITVSCPHCGVQLRFDNVSQGDGLFCTSCQQSFVYHRRPPIAQKPPPIPGQTERRGVPGWVIAVIALAVGLPVLLVIVISLAWFSFEGAVLILATALLVSIVVVGIFITLYWRAEKSLRYSNIQDENYTCNAGGSHRYSNIQDENYTCNAGGSHRGCIRFG